MDLKTKKQIEDLLGKITLDEKIGQMGASKIEEFFENGEFSLRKAKKLVNRLGIGVLHNLGKNPEQNINAVNTIQKFLIEHTRLGIPAIITGEGLHGHMSEGATVFPQAIGMASTWNTDLIQQIGSAIAKEARAVGTNQLFSPVLDLAREPRWGRVQETYGEDPYLTSRMGVAYIKGLQGEGSYIDQNHVVATPKHFVAHGTPEGGINISPVHIGKRELREIYLPAFKVAVCEGKAKSIMPCYSEIDGVPCICSKELLTEILREEWGFNGYVYSDWGAIEMLYTTHHTAATLEEAGKQALEAGVDIEAPRPEAFGERLLKMVKRGQVSIEVIDKAVSRILRVKFLLGLFENPYADIEKAKKILDCREHRELAYMVAKESIVLLRNEGNLLPLSKNISSIAVIGPNANRVQLGNYSGSNSNLVTVFQGVKNKVSSKTKVQYVEGCGICEFSTEGISKAVEIVKKSDVTIVVVGESNEVCGEGVDQSDLNLPGIQLDLVRAIHETKTPIVVVLMNGRPLSINWLAKNVPAILEAWYPGEEGGNAVADILFGDYNPSGKLPVSFPRSVGHLPVWYNYKPSARGYYHKPGSPGNPGRDYVFSSPIPLFEFGYGLSYTRFKYSNLRISPEQVLHGEEVTVRVVVENIGKCKGDEVVQLFITDVVSSVTTSVKALKGFKKITLEPGERENVRFTLTPSDLSLIDLNMESVVEPGIFKVIIDKLKGTFKVIGKNSK